MGHSPLPSRPKTTKSQVIFKSWLLNKSNTFKKELKKYTKDQFFFHPNNGLAQVCNAPTDKSGVYLVYDKKTNQQAKLIYIGRSGKIKSDGTMFVRKAGFGGMKDRLVNGKQFGKPRRISWKKKMEAEKIEMLKICWYVTHNDKYNDCPKIIEGKFLQKYHDNYKKLPRWNKRIR